MSDPISPNGLMDTEKD
uniref:Uncharacterized protein n=1 Tax=Anguilla anguilla TaxID=7936 RepID=A0A0E9TKA3_ANGAN